MKDGSVPPAMMEEASAAGAARGSGVPQGPRGKYVILFAMLFVILSLVNLDFENRTDYGFARIERMRNGASFFSTARMSDASPAQFASDLNTTQAKVSESERIVDRFMEKLDERRGDYWSRLTFIDLGDYRFYFGANLFMNFLFAFFIGGFSSNEIQQLAIGNIVAFVVAMLAIKFFIGFLKKHGFRVWGYYRIVVGLALLVLILTGYISR